jgi:hypothetical protein
VSGPRAAAGSGFATEAACCAVEASGRGPYPVDPPQRQASHGLAVAQRDEQRQPRAGRGASHEQEPLAHRLHECVQVVGPDLVFGADALDADVGGAAVAPVVQQHAIACLGEPLRGGTGSWKARRALGVGAMNGP